MQSWLRVDYFPLHAVKSCMRFKRKYEIISNTIICVPNETSNAITKLQQ